MSRHQILFGFALLLAACGPSAATRQAQSAAQALATAAVRLTHTQAAEPSATPTYTATPNPSPTSTQTPITLPTDTPSPTATPTTTRSAGIDPNALLIYYYVVGSGSPGECGDRAIPFSLGVLKTGDPVADVKTALNALFGNSQPFVGGFENPIGSSNIKIEDVFLSANGRFVQVIASGTVIKNKADYCQWARIREQVRTTLNRAAAPLTVDIQFNGKPFNDFVSGDQ